MRRRRTLDYVTGVRGVTSPLAQNTPTADRLRVGLEVGGELTIASGLVNVSALWHTVDTESDAASDNLAGAYGGSEGQLVFLNPEADARTVVVMHNDVAEGVDGTRFFLSDDADLTLDDVDDGILLMWRSALDSGNGGWQEVARGNMAGLLAAHVAAADPHTGYQKESEKDAASGYAGLSAASTVNFNPASATVTPAAAKIPISGVGGTLAAGWIPDLSGTYVPLATFNDHSGRHEDGGADEISLTGLVGELRYLVFHIDGGGSAITTGVKVHIPDLPACTVEAWTLVADQSGSIVIDVWNDTYANTPPTVADTMISTGTKPTLSSAQKNQDTSVDWADTTIAAGSTLTLNVDSATTVTFVTLTLRLRTT